MTTARERMEAILDEVDNKAYRKGWEDATKELEILALQRLKNRSDAEKAGEIEE